MSIDPKLKLETVAAVVVAFIALASAVGTFYLLPYRMAAAEAAIVVIQNDQRATRDVLIRIDENVKQLKEAVHK